MWRYGYVVSRSYIWTGSEHKNAIWLHWLYDNTLSIEYIVAFTGYYSNEAREGFITAALQGIEGWAILARNNPGQQYPSDFSLVKVCVIIMILIVLSW